MLPFLPGGIAIVALMWALAGAIPAAAAVDDHTRVALEALSRLKDADLEANPALKQAVLRVLDQVRGEPEFVEVVRDFRLAGHEGELIRIIGLHPQSPQAAEAARLLIGTPGAPGLAEALQSVHGQALVGALGASRDSRAVVWLQPMITATNLSPALRTAAVQALAQTGEGANTLIALARENKLPAELKSASGTALRAARSPEIRQAAAELFPAESATVTVALPALDVLLGMTGDPQRGAAIFRRPEVACITCHQVNGEGVDFGPKLSEIGTKLGRDALIASILEPSAGISFGFEAWRIELKNGDELFGMVVSDAEEELVVKQQGGEVTRVRKSEVTAREKQPLSIMPAGLHQSLTAQEFVDLIAYLSSLKTAAAPTP